MKKLLGRLVGLAAAAGAGYYIYDRFVKDERMMIEVIDIDTSDIVEMFEARDFHFVASSNNTVLHVTKADKTEAIQAKVENGQMTRIEYYGENEASHIFLPVFSKDKSEVNEVARRQFINCLGSVGVTEDRFIKFTKEVLSYPELLDGSI